MNEKTETKSEDVIRPLFLFFLASALLYYASQDVFFIMSSSNTPDALNHAIRGLAMTISSLIFVLKAASMVKDPLK